MLEKTTPQTEEVKQNGEVYDTVSTVTMVQTERDIVYDFNKPQETKPIAELSSTES